MIEDYVEKLMGQRLNTGLQKKIGKSAACDSC